MESRSRSGRLFDHYLIVDWSAAAAPVRGRDSIWIASLQTGPRGSSLRDCNPGTRAEATGRIRALLLAALAAGRRTLLGVDFPLGYPRGFAGALGLGAARLPWWAVWDEIAAQIEDHADNRNNRFEAAAVFNTRISGAAAPFWGRPPGYAAAGAALGARKPPALPAGLTELRLCERRTPGTQSVWKLYTAGSVGSQALTGIPRLRALRDDPALVRHLRIWPFETGFAPPTGRHSIVAAEVWPSMLRAPAPSSALRDRVQVRALARHFARLDRGGLLACLFAAPAGLSTEERRVAIEEEGWILG